MFSTWKSEVGLVFCCWFVLVSFLIFFVCWGFWGFFVYFANNNEFYHLLCWLLRLKREKPNNFTVFFWELNLIKVMIRAGNVTKHRFFFFFSSILSSVFSETLSVSHHICTSHINSFPQINILRTDVPMCFKEAAKLSGGPAVQSHVPAYLGRANLLFGAQFPFIVPCWWARARTIFKPSNLLWYFWLKLAI